MEDKYTQVIKEYINGTSIKNLAKKYNMGTRTIRKKLIENDIEIRGYSSTKKELSDEVISSLIKEFNEGNSLRELEKKYFINRFDISLALKQRGIDIQNRQLKIDEDIFETIDTEEKAYWLGFLYADGNVYKTTISISLKGEDIGHLEKFKAFLKSEHPIMKLKSKCAISTNPDKILDVCKIMITSKKLSNDLINLGCVRKKSLILKFPSEDMVPRHLMKHFIRGYFDGDGSIAIDKSKTHSLVFQVTGTYEVLLGIKEHYLIKSNIRKVGNIYDLRCKGNIKALSIFDDMYNDCTVYLDRKYNIYKDFKCRLGK